MVREEQHVRTQPSPVIINTETREKRNLFARTRADATATSPTVEPVIELDDDSFPTAITGCITIVDFWAPWCGPCKTLHPMFDKLADKHGTHPKLQFARVNVDTSPSAAEAFNIQSIPTLVVLNQSGQELDREVGLPGKRRLQRLARNARHTLSKGERQ